jgi:hypothetical protein
MTTVYFGRNMWLLSGAYAKLRKASISCVACVRPSAYPSVRMEHWEDIHGIWCLSTFRKSVEKIQVSLKSDKNSGYVT